MNIQTIKLELIKLITETRSKKLRVQIKRLFKQPKNEEKILGKKNTRFFSV